MSFHHRKLLNDSFDDSIPKICKPYCVDLTLNTDGSCPILCMSQCYPICKRPLFDDLPPPPPSTSFSDHPGKSYGLPVFLTISLALLATAFCIFFCYTVYKFYKGWCSSRRQRQRPARPQDGDEEAPLDFLDEDLGPVVDHPIWYIRTVGLQPSVISAITICKYKRGDGLVEGTECSVCLNEFQEDETLRLLPKCNHAFHIPCIDTWLRSHTNCPMCRAGIVINTASLQSSGQSNSDSGRVEEAQVRVSENIRESGTDREDEELQQQQRVTTEAEDQELRAQNVLKRHQEDVAGNSYARDGDGVQPIRRSVSMDSLSASMISFAVTNTFPLNSDRSSDKQVLEMNGTSSAITLKRVDADQNLSKSACSSSNERSLQKGSSSMVMRSLSCSAKVFLSRYRNSVPLPRSF